MTWTQARNFAYGIWLLPPAKRRAMCAIYALARRVDDIGDGPLPAAEKLARLEDVRRRLADPGDLGDPVLRALADTRERFPLPMEAFGELIDGVRMDVRGVRYETADDLAGYCRRVAGTIGRLSVAVFGTDDPVRADRLAETLGVALQLTNILRDVAEDFRDGRIYLPAEDRLRFGWAGGPPRPAPGFDALVRLQARRAEALFEEGLGLLPMLDRRSAACVGAMSGIYRRLLRRITRRPGAVLDGRTSLPTVEKLEVAARALAGLRVSGPRPADLV
ncbi:MAG TPA: presqualene diphosphate synthase HpnD [Thermomonospora sp.]|nr:presqualene diphosphate synthase HpnD [Thermomonospora sp.]